MRIGHEIAAGEAPRLEIDPIGPFQPGALHPGRRARILAGDEIEPAAGGFYQADALPPVAIARGERLLGRRAEAEPKNVRPRMIDVGDDPLLVAVAAKVAASVSGDLERRIKLPGAARGLIDDRLGGAKQIDAGTALLRDNR